MPIYDYQCRNCGHRVELIHGVNASGPTACEQCGGPMRKLLTTPSIVFKGSGWAKKDRSSASARSSAKSDESTTPAAPTESTESTSKSDSASSGGDGSSAKEKSATKTPAKDTTSTSGTGPTD
jgi:putative FmdB family regulatory protein